MEDHKQMSWKEDNAISQVHNSVDNASTAVGQAQTHPTEQTIQHAQEAIEHADRAIINTLQTHENLEPLQSLQAQLNQSKEEIKRLH